MVVKCEMWYGLGRVVLAVFLFMVRVKVISSAGQGRQKYLDGALVGRAGWWEAGFLLALLARATQDFACAWYEKSLPCLWVNQLDL